ncbi:hypothetical protein F2P56_027742 [Juglans regia]|uniref:RNase H type-1 domain-containing protein n=1 Tax=Juglans regia TaxID=51240 RepID=A0A833UIN6_JUGRE|nr:hypothetical protein F2P56_027742 [Juglans regia]
MSREETRLSHLAKKNWLRDGDQNSKFFHAYLNVKKHNRVSDMCLVDGTRINSPTNIHQAAVEYFQDFLGQHSNCELPNLNHLISPVISEEENSMLCKDPSLDDIKDALFSIPIDSSPGPDGFGSGFFRKCWDFVKEDLLEATLEFFHSHQLSRFFNSSYIVLIPKARGTPLISHLMYADDIVIFANGSKRSIKGVPIVTGRLKASDFTDLLGKVKKKIAGWKMKLLSIGGRTVLLRHVLSSMATHLLAVLHVPKIVIRELNKLLSSFFWGDYEGKGKRKWVAWKKNCCPIEEGGLGIRDFEDIQRALHMKLAWRLMSGHSLWADFFKGKYVKDKHLSLLVPNKGTRVWKSIVKSIPDVIHNSKWLVREGNISFWYDNWDEDGPLQVHYPVTDYPMIKIKECCIENGWDISLLERLVGQQKANDIYQFLARRKEGQDVLVWLKEKNGNFSTKSAWDCIRIQAPPLNWASWIWHSSIPKKISIMMWKASNNCLSVDAKVQMAGIPMVSKCNCCVFGNMEDLNHVLCTGDFARQLWRMAAVQLGVHMGAFRTWNDQIDFWFRRAGKSSQVKTIFGLIPSIVSWKLWERRCKARFDGHLDTIETVWSAIKSWICRIMHLNQNYMRLHSHDIAILKSLDIPAWIPRAKKITVVKWNPPQRDRVKLNTDGSSLGNPGSAGAGGVIRDDNGKMCAGYVVSLGQGSNNFAELRSLLEGVRRCCQRGFFRVDIETDSQILVNWIKKGKCNVVADFLAKLGAEGLNMDWFEDRGTLPGKLRGLLRMDRIGLPYLRIS